MFEEKMSEYGDERNQKTNVRQSNNASLDRQFDLIGHRQDGDETEDVEPHGNALLLFFLQWINVARRLEIVTWPNLGKQFRFRMKRNDFAFIDFRLAFRC